MLPLVVDVEAPTTAIWWTLLRYYLFLGFAAGAVVTVWLLYWVVKYREKKDVRPAPGFHHEEESGWGNWKTVVLTLMITGTVLGFVEYETFASTNLIVPPHGDPVYINVTAEQFAWSFTYPNGYTSVDNLTVPANQVVVLNITSVDVDHSLAILSLNVAKDAIPGQHNFLWFNATQTGFFKDDIRCKELCGVGHADMVAGLNVTTAAVFSQFLSNTSPHTTTSASTGTPTGATATIYLPQGAGGAQELNFSPATLTVSSGTTITFVDQDTDAPHNVYFTSVPSGATVPSPNPSPVLNKGSTFQVTLTTPGTYHYECQFHTAWMQGTIVVSG